MGKQSAVNDLEGARFGPMLDEMDALTDRHNLLAGEQIYLMTLLLLGSIQDAPADVRELFRGAAVQSLLREPDAGRVLRLLCVDGRIERTAEQWALEVDRTGRTAR